MLKASVGIAATTFVVKNGYVPVERKQIVVDVIGYNDADELEKHVLFELLIIVFASITPRCG